MSKLKNHCGNRTLILGEVGTGKTKLTVDLLNQVLEKKTVKVAFLDLAPGLTKGIGSKANVPQNPLLRYYTTEIVPPRLTAQSPEEAKSYALQNARAIEVLFSSYMRNKCEVLFINDVSLYLQAGEMQKLLTVTTTAPSVIMNGYYGFSLGGKSFGKHERQQMKELRKRCDKVIML